MKLSTAERAYVAGILDGEGSFCFYSTKWTSNKSSGIRYVPTVVVEMSDSRVVYKIAELFGKPVESRKRGTNSRTYTVKFSSIGIKALIEQVGDLLVSKTEQAKLMMLWFDVFGFNTNNLHFAFQRIDLQKVFYDYCRALNIRKRGELRESLSNEAILSQAVEEIRLKVQRLEDEAKEIVKNRILDVIKSSGRISRSDLYRVTHCRNVFELNKILDSLPVTHYRENRVQYYVYAGNASTSAPDQEEESSGYDIVRTVQ